MEIDTPWFQECVNTANEAWGFPGETRLLDRQDFQEEAVFSEYRNTIWEDVIPDYKDMNKQERRRYKEAYMGYLFEQPVNTVRVTSLSLGDLKPMAEAIYFPTQEKEKNMRTENDNKREHLTCRLWGIENRKEDAAMRHFGLKDDEYPRTAEELVKRIKEGRYVIREHNDDDFGGWMEDIRWRHPDKKADKEGFNAFKAAMDKDGEDVRDAIAIQEPVEALKVLKDFEAKTYH